MSDVERALTAAIRATTEARRAIGEAAVAYDFTAVEELKSGDSNGQRAV